jgi:DNA (cytosine-5)-methyltransferase 1
MPEDPKNYGSVDSSLGCMVKSPGEPLGTVTGQDHHAVVTMPRPFLTSYYGRGVGATATDEPASTVTTTSRHGLVEPGSTPAIEDCTFRMLEPAEIGRAMAFPDAYKVLGNKRQRVRQYGNAVTPPVMAMILRRAIASLAPGGECS